MKNLIIPKCFNLIQEPLDYQVCLHITNLFETFGRFEVMSNYDYLRNDDNDYGIVYDMIKPRNDIERLTCAMFNLLKYYGYKRFDNCLELFGEKILKKEA